MQYFWPVVQTALWVWLIWYLFKNLREHLDALLAALKGRLEDGSDLKIGPVEILSRAKPQSMSEQAEKLSEEVSEQRPADTAQETNSAEADIYAEPSISKGSAHVERAHALSSTYPHSESAAARKNGDLVRRYVIAEDLALRAIQVQYEATLNRQITWGRDNGFDGAFAKDGRLHVVEVKYVSNGGSELPLRRAAKRLASAIQGYGWKSVTILLVAVYENANDMPGPTLSDAPAILGYPVKLHRYSIEQLKANFEAIDSDVEAQ